jgi:DNA segregation ATPase FtsK/SpoIIIE-like protein
MLLSLCRSTSCEEAQVIFLDPKYDEDWSALAGLPHVTLYSDTDDCIKAIRATHAELNRRRKAPDSRKVFLVIDEFADLITGIADKVLQDEVQTMIARIAQIGRSKNIHLVLCTQKPTIDVIDTVAKGNFSSRLGGAVTTPEESRVGMGRGDVGCENLPGKGAFYVILAGGPVQRIQGYFIDAETLQDEIDQIILKTQWQTPYTIDLEPPTDRTEAEEPQNTEAQQMAQKILVKYKYADLYKEDGKIRQGMQLKAIQVNYPGVEVNEGEPRRKTLEALKEIKLLQATTPTPAEASAEPTDPTISGS